MNKPSDPMQGFLEQLLQDWETGGTKTPAPAKPAKTPSVGMLVETPGIASVVRALPELAEAVSLNAVDEPLAPVVAAPAVAETPWPTMSWTPAAPVAEDPAAAAAEPQSLPKPTFQWKPLAEAAPAESSSSDATPIRVVVPTEDPVTNSRAPEFEEAAAAFAPPSPEQAKPIFQWKPAPPPSAAASSTKADDAPTDPLADTAPQFSKPTFQWKPTPASPAAHAVPEARQDTESAPTPVEQPKTAFQWKLSQPSTASSTPAATPSVFAEAAEATPSAAVVPPAPAAPAPPVSAVTTYTPPALVDFAAALSALKASRPTKADRKSVV